jgi:hypothetical protein
MEREGVVHPAILEILCFLRLAIALENVEPDLNFISLSTFSKNKICHDRIKSQKKHHTNAPPPSRRQLTLVQFSENNNPRKYEMKIHFTKTKYQPGATTTNPPPPFQKRSEIFSSTVHFTSAPKYT